MSPSVCWGRTSVWRGGIPADCTGRVTGAQYVGAGNRVRIMRSQGGGHHPHRSPRGWRPMEARTRLELRRESRRDHRRMPGRRTPPPGSPPQLACPPRCHHPCFLGDAEGRGCASLVPAPGAHTGFHGQALSRESRDRACSVAWAHVAPGFLCVVGSCLYGLGLL